jgi:S1-C subfamily serine protease
MKADVIAVDEESDLCILRVYRSIKPVALSTRELMPGDTVYYSGYPLGIYAPNTLHTFSGRFSGSDSMGFQMYSLPAAPGSSGSPIYDEHGKLIGILSAIPEDFSHLSIGAGLDRIKMFLYLAKDCQKYCVD